MRLPVRFGASLAVRARLRAGLWPTARAAPHRKSVFPAQAAAPRPGADLPRESGQALITS